MKTQRTKQPALHVSRGGAPRRPRTAEPAPPREREGGVYEDPHRVNGTRLFTVINSAGECLMRIEVKPDFATDEFETWLWNWLEAEDPIAASPAIQLL